MNIYIPIFIIVASNTIYHICAKSTPSDVNTFASLSVTYLVGAAVSVILYFVTQKGGNILNEYRHLNWTAYVLGAAIIGLEAGNILMYKVGWTLATGQIVQSAILAVVLILVGLLFYHEGINLQKLIGIFVCLAGLYIINK